jgi:TonB C terminal
MVPCDELKRLTAVAAVHADPDRAVASGALVTSSGNAAFDARVESTLRGTIGSELPAPPPVFPDMAVTHLKLTFTGQAVRCDESTRP